MEGSAEDFNLVNSPSRDDADLKSKDSKIPNGLNGDYGVDNDDAIFLSDNGESKNLDKCENSDNISKNGDMEVDSDLTADNSDGKSVDKNVESGEVSDSNKECKDDSVLESMDVDAQSNASDDVECIGDGDKEEAGNDLEDDDEDSLSEPKFVGSSSQKQPKDDDAETDDVQPLDRSIEVLDSSQETSNAKNCEENGSVGSPDVEEITDGDGKSNGHNSSTDSLKETPKKKNKKAIDLTNVTPRRSSRNVNRKSYTERDLEDGGMIIDNSSDIEEIKMEDPLAEVDNKDKENSKLKSSIKSISSSNNKTTIVVNDTKRLVEIAAGSKNIKGGKKEPTLVIIDTNSILSGKGGVPVSSSSKSSHHSSSSHLNISGSSSSSFSMLPMGMGTQQIFNTRTTITPVPMKTPQINSSKSTTITPVINPAHLHQQLQQQQLQHQQLQQQQLPQILPTLTDDMFVVEAPSFIVPYVYEKPPIKPLKNFIDKLGKGIKDFDEGEKARKKAEKEKRKAEGGEGDNKDEDDDSDEDDKNDTPKEKSEFNAPEDKNKIPTYFDLPLGKFFMTIGMNLVQEYVQTDLLRTQKRKHSKGGTSAETQMAINSLIKNLEFSKENNEPFHLELKKCEFCNFKTESALAMQHHLETPHMRNYVYKCNHCPTEARSPHDILFHLEAIHNIRGRLERGPAFHQCPNCPFEDNQKGKLTRHILACQKKFRPDRNLEPALDWEPPAKIPRINRPRNMGPAPSSAALALAMGMKGNPQAQLLPKLLPAPGTTGRGRGRPPVHPRYPDMKNLRPTGSPGMRQDNMASMMYRPTSSGMMMPNSYQFNNSQIFQVVGGSGTVISALSGVSSSSGGSSGRPAPIALANVNETQSRLLSSQNTSVTNASSAKNPTAKLLSQPSISITPLPRTAAQPSTPGSGSSSKVGGKSTFVICEICDGYIKDLEQLRNHMQWIHKVKIHPKMIYNRPPLNCQKCQFRFFTDQGLERHLLGSHGLVTSSMQDAANKGKDAGRCPACGRVFQWKLLNHVARDHGMTLKPAHLSYKCTVCTATFGMYKQFENHVYSAHSVVAKRVMDKKGGSPSSPSSRSNDSLLKPLKINDEITIIPQPAKPANRQQGRNK